MESLTGSRNEKMAKTTCLLSEGESEGAEVQRHKLVRIFNRNMRKMLRQFKRAISRIVKYDRGLANYAGD